MHQETCIRYWRGLGADGGLRTLEIPTEHIGRNNPIDVGAGKGSRILLPLRVIHPISVKMVEGIWLLTQFRRAAAKLHLSVFAEQGNYDEKD